MSDTPSSPSPARDPSGSLLGKTASYRATYAPELLYPISRTPKREEIGLSAERIAAGRLPFMGADLWTAYELSWLTPCGKPQVAIATITVPCDSPCIIESKSFKLYLNSFNMTRVESPERLREMLVHDLSAAAGARVGVRLVLPEAFDAQPVTETLTSHLLKSNCLVTGQPDWGSVQISYTGPQIDQEGLLRYLISFREHDEFHEQCVERIFTDILERCQPVRLQVYARYTRRGGLDISPWRTSHPATLPANVRTARQ